MNLRFLKIRAPPTRINHTIYESEDIAINHNVKETWCRAVDGLTPLRWRCQETARANALQIIERKAHSVLSPEHDGNPASEIIGNSSLGRCDRRRAKGQLNNHHGIRC